MARILILISGHLANAPRPVKEADALADAGHSVVVRGFHSDPQLIDRDRQLMSTRNWSFMPFVHFRSNTTLGQLNQLKVRTHSRVAREVFRRFGKFSPETLGYGVRSMLAVARKARPDLTIVHSEAGLWVAQQLLDEGFNVGVDFEDWFSEDLLPEDRLTRPVARLKSIERRLARACTYCLTTSNILAQTLAQTYSVSEPTVVYNSFPSIPITTSSETSDRHDPKRPSLHWFSQTIGPGRGLETLFQALNHLRARPEIHLRGNLSEDRRPWLELQIPTGWRENISLHPTVSPEELPRRIAEHDIGLALEIPYCRSRELTITNKLFQYLQAGLAVIATDTAGQREILSAHAQAGRLLPPDDPIELARALDELLGSPSALSSAKTAATNAYQDYAWENQVGKLLASSEQALKAGRLNRGSHLA